MRIDKWVTFEQEVSVHIDARDAVAAIMEGYQEGPYVETPTHLVGQLCSRFLLAMKALPDAEIEKFNVPSRKIIADELAGLEKRFRAAGVEAKAQ